MILDTVSGASSIGLKRAGQYVESTQHREAKCLEDSAVRYQRSTNAAKLYADMEDAFAEARGIKTRYKAGWQDDDPAPWRSYAPVDTSGMNEEVQRRHTPASANANSNRSRSTPSLRGSTRR